MKNSKFLIAILVAMFLTTYSNDLVAQDQEYSYAYISIHGKIFSKKLKVIVDLGDSPEQIIAGDKYSEKLTNKKSYAAVLNYMVENQFELVETLDFIYTYQGSGGTSGIVFIMKKKN
jgi:hypothetical protein